jgi:hypothetical protein
MSPPNIPASPELQLDLIAIYLDELEAYLLSDELFWPIGSVNLNFPKLTLGNLLLAMKTAGAGQPEMNVDLQARFHQYKTRWHQASVKWASAISNKAVREMGARLNLWRGYLTDLAEGNGRRLLYPSEVRNRVLFELLVPFTQDKAQVSELQKNMAVLDQRIQALSQPAPFQWEDSLQADFPLEAYPFLYRTITKLA